MLDSDPLEVRSDPQPWQQLKYYGTFCILVTREVLSNCSVTSFETFSVPSIIKSNFLFQINFVVAVIFFRFGYIFAEVGGS